ncbi:MAG: ester cyclase [Thermoplasmatota archaeon]
MAHGHTLIKAGAVHPAMLPPPVQGFFTAHSQRDPRLLDPLLDDGFVGHVNGRELRGAAALRQELASLAAAFPDAAYTVQDGVREGDRVAVRWEMEGTQRGPFGGRPASGRRVRGTGLTLFRVTAGHIAELWTCWTTGAEG